MLFRCFLPIPHTGAITEIVRWAAAAAARSSPVPNHASRAVAVRIAVIGDRHERFAAQDAIDHAVAHSAEHLGLEATTTWIGTAELDDDPDARLDGYDAYWCAPGSPYASLDGALAGIRVARETGRPFLGTCAGFQHAVVEFARNALGADARHAEYGDAGSGAYFIDKLECSLVGLTMPLAITDPEAAALIGATEVEEQYYCSFGLDEARLPDLERYGLVRAGVDLTDGGTRILRLAGHRFFYLTLFVPQVRSTATEPHPLVTAFVAAAAGIEQ